MAVSVGVVTLAEALAVGLSIAVVICFCAVGCMMNKHDSYTSHNVKGIRASSVSHLSSNN